MTKQKTEPEKSNNEKIMLLLAYLCTKDMEKLEEKVDLLDQVSFTTPEIASFLKINNKAVYNARDRIK